MSKSCDNLDAELEQLVSKLDDYAERFRATAELAIPCWINGEKHQAFPSDTDITRNLFRWARIETLHEKPRRIVWMYQDDLQPAKPLIELLEEFGVVLADLSEEARSLVYVGWCKHFLPDYNDKVAFSIEALFPEPAWHRPRLPQHLKAESQGIIEVKRISGRYTEIYLKNLAEAAAHFTIELAERLRTDPQPIYPPTEGELCCSVAEEEERRRPKKPEEILPIIQKLKVRWQRPDDYGPPNPQQLIDDLWADMVPLGWILPPCPKLSEVRPLAHVTDPPAKKKQWREYLAALSDAEHTAREHLPAPSGSSVANKIREAQTKAIETHSVSITIPLWFSSVPPEESKYKYGVLEGCVKDLANWIGVDRRTLQKHNGSSAWWIQKIHDRMFCAWFSDQNSYAKANQRRLGSQSPGDMK
ncbi:MAG: hypothetical protein IH898_11990 [Planctomycetes bacterium]|nr:hypothetical protein [Planctomycetota bacterium]